LWIEVNAPAASALVPGGYDSDPFPVVIEQDSQSHSCSFPPIDLSKQPVIDLKHYESWLGKSLGDFLSKREKNIVTKDLEIQNFRSMLPYYKSTLHDILRHVGEGNEKRYFVLAGRGRGRMFLIC
jgi:hypothetical protein